MASLQRELLIFIKVLLGLGADETLPTYQLVAAVTSIFCVVAGLLFASFAG